jgi:hypothetical protein
MAKRDSLSLRRALGVRVAVHERRAPVLAGFSTERLYSPGGEERGNHEAHRVAHLPSQLWNSLEGLGRGREGGPGIDAPRKQSDHARSPHAGDHPGEALGAVASVGALRLATSQVSLTRTTVKRRGSRPLYGRAPRSEGTLCGLCSTVCDIYIVKPGMQWRIMPHDLSPWSVEDHQTHRRTRACSSLHPVRGKDDAYLQSVSLNIDHITVGPLSDPVEV